VGLDRDAHPVTECAQADGFVDVGLRGDGPAPQEGRRPVTQAEDGEAAPRNAGVHPEHDRIEHLFAGV
jgi:hypothetical protein